MENKKIILVPAFIIIVVVCFISGRIQVTGEPKSGADFDVQFTSGDTSWIAMRVDALGAWANLQLSYKDLRKKKEDSGEEEALNEKNGVDEHGDAKAPSRSFKRRGLEGE